MSHRQLPSAHAHPLCQLLLGQQPICGAGAQVWAFSKPMGTSHSELSPHPGQKGGWETLTNSSASPRQGSHPARGERTTGWDARYSFTNVFTVPHAVGAGPFLPHPACRFQTGSPKYGSQESVCSRKCRVGRVVRLRQGRSHTDAHK